MFIQHARFVTIKNNFLFEVEEVCTYQHAQFLEGVSTGPQLIMSIPSSNPQGDAFVFFQQFDKKTLTIILTDDVFTEKQVPFHLLHHLKWSGSRLKENRVEAIFDYLPFGSREHQSQQFLITQLTTEWNKNEHRSIRRDLYDRIADIPY